MAEPLLTDVFGAGATQTETTLTISKTALGSVGLTASANNTAESLIVSLIKLWSNYLTETRYNENPYQSVYLDRSTPSLVGRVINDELMQYRQDAYSIVFSKLETNNDIDPDNY
ncbi:MAG TPA: hypothetical protein V6C58_02275 [Allocoleopsis sp.]